MKIVEDHIVISYFTRFEGTDLEKVPHKHRDIYPEFSSSPLHMRDIQYVIDENHLNYWLFSMFYRPEPISLTEVLLELVPSDDQTLL